MKEKANYWLAFIFLAALTVRLVLAFSTPAFTYDSYFNLRQVDYISNNGFPQFHDELSYSGRDLRFLPLFHYFTALFDLITPDQFIPPEIIAKIIPNLLIASLVIIVYHISDKMTGSKTASLFSAGIAAFLPTLYETNSFTVEALFIPLIFLITFCFINLKEKNFVYYYIIAFLAACLTSSATFLIIVGFGIYLLLSAIEGKKLQKAEVEIILFSLFFYVWTQFLFFKEVLASEGMSFIWQNIPQQIMRWYFPQPSLLDTMLSVSIIPFLAGIYVVGRSLFKLKNTKEFLYISLVISTTILTWLRLVQFKLSITFFSIILAIFFASFYKEMVDFFKRTRIKSWKIGLPAITIILLAATMIFPALTTAKEQSMPSMDAIQAFRWFGETIPQKTTTLVQFEEGNALSYYAGKRNVMDDHFSLQKDAEQRILDISTMYITTFQTEALGLFDKYRVGYIILTPKAKSRFSVDNFHYITQECFEPIYNQEVKIYRVRCTLKEA
ncbi:hypothetical protein COV20_03710 [Candidatus Woesearchaeota archaeon CG10_big_fil_rev_8_21_14_0_10_45_16]|nr:MAG: hypothetical protein COV20_03710 [Candidatus Woesearchaeota archaeon CG10_big_fil_rev_8_21_14_0_10_45_16]